MQIHRFEFNPRQISAKIILTQKICQIKLKNEREKNKESKKREEMERGKGKQKGGERGREG